MRRVTISKRAIVGNIAAAVVLGVFLAFGSGRPRTANGRTEDHRRACPRQVGRRHHEWRRNFHSVQSFLQAHRDHLIHGWGVNFYYPTYVNIGRAIAERGYTCITANPYADIGTIAKWHGDSCIAAAATGV